MNRGNQGKCSGTTSQGDLLAAIFARMMQARRRAAALEGKDPDAEAEILPETIAGLQAFVDDTNPRAAHLRFEFWGRLDRHVDDLSLRVDRSLKISTDARRQALRSKFKLIEGGRRG